MRSAMSRNIDASRASISKNIVRFLEFDVSAPRSRESLGLLPLRAIVLVVTARAVPSCWPGSRRLLLRPLLTGKQFTLGRATLPLEVVAGKRRTVTIPEGATVKVVSGPRSDGIGLVNVLWEGRPVALFSVDLKTRGTEIAGTSATA